MRTRLIGCAMAGLLGLQVAGDTVSRDVVVYGGTSAGVIAAAQAAKMGRTVVIVAPEKHLGGLSAGGLGFTDIGNKHVIGGLARDFYRRIWAEYQKPERWTVEEKKPYGGQGVNVAHGEETWWVFEPHVAESVFEGYIAEHRIEVLRHERLDLTDGVKKDGARIVSFRTESGKTFVGKMFIDATYEGDLLAKAGVSYHVGREPNSQYGETINGVQKRGAKSHQFEGNVSAYKVEGDPYSGLLPRISAGPPGEDGSGDRRIQAYNFRMCLTDHPENRVPFPKPEGYDASQYELLLRVLKAGSKHVFGKFDRIPNRKTDTNNHGPFSTDNIGMNWDYPDGDYATRERIVQEHIRYQQGYLWFLANDPRVPEAIRTNYARWGLAKDEFTDHGHWPHQMYVREARRMVSEVVMSEKYCRGSNVVEDSVGMGAYNMDSHNVQRYVDEHGYVRNEGDIQIGVKPYGISYRSIVPRKSECVNLLVPVCLSASHIAYGSIRMEPVFMIMGQSAATAASLAIDGNSAVQDIKYDELRQRLLADRQILEFSGAATSGHASPPIRLDGVVVDDADALLSGEWQKGTLKGTVGGYQHDGNEGKGQKTARFAAKLPKAGNYEVRLYYPASANRATKVPVMIATASGEEQVAVDERGGAQPFAKLGVYAFTAEKSAVVTVSNAGTDGFVAVDAVQFLLVE